MIPLDGVHYCWDDRRIDDGSILDIIYNCRSNLFQTGRRQGVDRAISYWLLRWERFFICPSSVSEERVSQHTPHAYFMHNNRPRGFQSISNGSRVIIAQFQPQLFTCLFPQYFRHFGQSSKAPPLEALFLWSSYVEIDRFLRQNSQK